MFKQVLSNLKRFLFIVAPISVAIFFFLPRILDLVAHRNYNPGEVISISPEARQLHQEAVVIDLHSDSLLWQRDLNQQNFLGQVNVPKLQRGNVAIEGFTLVSEVPPVVSPTLTLAWGDLINALVIGQGWPAKTWFSPYQRLIYQVKRLHRFSRESNGNLTIIKTRADLEEFLIRRQQKPNLVAGFLGLEGVMGMRHSLKDFDALYEAGVRMIALTHFQDTVFSGSAHGVHKAGLSLYGRLFIHQIKTKNVLVDISHVAEPAILDILSIVEKPIVVSHTGVQGTCPNARNISDRLLHAIQKNDGVIGVGFFPLAICSKELEGLVNAMIYIKEKIGIRHIGLGSDYDGTAAVVRTPDFMGHITQALLNRPEHFSKQEVKAILGQNALRVLRANL